MLLFATVLQAQPTGGEAVNLDQLKEGDKLPEGGVYWPLQDETGKINLRFADGNRLRLYFVDNSDVIIKPTFEYALVRYYNDLVSEIKVPRNVAKLTKSGSGIYLASPRVLRQPLRYRVWVTLQNETPNESATADDALTKDKQSYGLRILSRLGKRN